MSRTLAAGVQWVRDDGRVLVIVPGSGNSLLLSGPEAQLWELWLEGVAVGELLERVGRCWQLDADAARASLRTLVERLAGCGAICEVREGTWPTFS